MLECNNLMEDHDLPGCDWMQIIYSDEEVVIRRNGDVIYGYHKTSYITPLFGKQKVDWLCSGRWFLFNNCWMKEYSDAVADTIDDVVEFIKGR